MEEYLRNALNEDKIFYAASDVVFEEPIKKALRKIKDEWEAYLNVISVHLV